MTPTLIAPEATLQFAEDVRAGLARPGQKELSSSYLYDALGSALFEAITYLPEYGLTRADERVIRLNSPSLLQCIPQEPLVVELGSGSGKKTRHILDAFSTGGRITYVPVDVSAAALSACQAELASVATVIPSQNTYLDGLRDAVRWRQNQQPVLLLFLGSTIGNFERPRAAEFLRTVRRELLPGDWLLLGADLVKPVDHMLLAYDDPTGVTAAFNLNLLGRINRELHANFNLRQFRHEASYNSALRRVEMHLRSTQRQAISIPGAQLELQMEAGETIWTESSHKFELGELDELAHQSGFSLSSNWLDEDWPFVESLWLTR